VTRWRRTIITAGLAVALGVMAASALAGGPLRGATYRGSLAGSMSAVAISFHVTANGTVEGVKLSRLPLYCAGNGPPAARISFASAKVSAQGTFAAAGRDVIASGPVKGSVAATLALTGRFGAGGAESGTLTTTYNGPAKRCGGRSNYATRG
jgi:hypothetical protein